MNKKELRKEYLTIRKDIKDKDTKSRTIFNKLIDLDIYKCSKVIGIYYSLEDEVDTIELIDYSIKIGKTVCIPKVLSNNTMSFYKIIDRSNLVKSSFNILEPNTNNLVNPNDIDLMIVPGIVFSKELYRIGYGGGYYDRYLKDTNSYKIGLSFKETLVDYLPHNDYDVKLNLIITDESVVWFNYVFIY